MSEHDVYMDEARKQIAQEPERNLSEYEMSLLYSHRAYEIQNRVENPAIWGKLTEIERKIDHVLFLLQNKT